MRQATPETIALWGGALCLDLANTVDRAEDGGHVAPELTDVLTAPELLVRWGVHVGVFGAGGWRYDWAADDPRRVRFAAVADAVALLGDADRLARVTRCPGHQCGWLFINASGRRRWCSM